MKCVPHIFIIVSLVWNDFHQENVIDISAESFKRKNRLYLVIFVSEIRNTR